MSPAGAGQTALAWGLALWLAGSFAVGPFSRRFPPWAASEAAWPWFGLAFVLAGSAWLATTAFTVLLFGWDKRQAAKDGRRVPESRLLWASFFSLGLGGWLAIALWRHKSRKRSFQVKLALVTALDAALLWGMVKWFEL